jgi:N-acetylneuraminate synthase
MNYLSWRDMVDRVRELELALGATLKKIEKNEEETVILQRRAIRAKFDIKSGSIVTKEMFEFLRPCPKNALPPNTLKDVIGKVLTKDLVSGGCLSWEHLK